MQKNIHNNLNIYIYKVPSLTLSPLGNYNLMERPLALGQCIAREYRPTQKSKSGHRPHT